MNKSIASLMLASASSSVSPSLIQPGRLGTVTVKPPTSKSGIKITWRILFPFLVTLPQIITLSALNLGVLGDFAVQIALQNKIPDARWYWHRVFVRDMSLL